MASKESEHQNMRGQCLCGGIQYQVDALESRMAHCHCSMCRKFHGAAFATFGEAKAENFRWLAGEELLQSYVADNGSTRQFCRNCGSSMTFAPRDQPDDGIDEKLIEFALGTLDSKIDTKPDAHIFTNFKADWFDINDQLDVFACGRDEES